MNIYDRLTDDFNNNGYGFLKDTISAKVVEVLNGEYSLSFDYPMISDLSEYLVKENIIKCNVGNSNYQLFRISYIESADDKFIKVYAQHIFYDLADNMLVDVYPTDKNCQEAVEWILAGANYYTDFTAYSDIADLNTQRYVRRNVVEALIGNLDNSIIKQYSAEIERNNKEIRMLARRGADNNVKVLYRKNIKEIKVSEDSTNIATRIMPMGANALLLPELFVDSPIMTSYVNPKIKLVEFSDVVYDPNDVNAYQNLEDAYNEMRNRVSLLYSTYNFDKPLLSISVGWIELSKVKEYYDLYSALEAIHLGDTIRVEYKDYLYTTRIIKTVYNVLLDKIESFEMGTMKPTFISSTETKLNTISETLSNPTSILQQAKDDATTLITSAMGGYVYKTQNEIFIMDTDNIATAQKVWRWNLNGLAYSSNGVSGDYQLAMTMDGKIVADFITTGVLDGALIQAGSITTDKIETEALVSGGDNLINNSVGFFIDDDWIDAHEGYTNTEIKQNTVSQNAWLLKEKTAVQTIQCQNEKYTISFKYKKLIELAECMLIINGYEIVLDSSTWEEKNYTVEVLSNTIEIQILSDTDDACYVSDLMLKQGIVKSIWSSANGESVKGGVKISNGIELTSAGSNIMQKINHDGNRIYNMTTDEIKSEFTDKGMKTSELEAETAIIADLLFVSLNKHTRISRL